MYRFLSVCTLHVLLRFVIRFLNWTISHHDQVCKANIRMIEGLQQANILLDREAVWASKAISRLETLLND